MAGAAVTRTAEQILDAHAVLTTRYRFPAWHLGTYMYEHIKEVAHAASAGMDSAAHMFWPVVRKSWRSIPSATGEQLARLIGGDLFTAQTVHVTKVMLDAMLDCAPETAVPARYAASSLPFPSAFAWLDEPWDVPDTGSGHYLIRAISWRRIEVLTDSGPWPTVRVVFWSWMPDEVAQGRYAGGADVDVMRKMGDLLMVHTSLIPLDSEFEVPGGPEEVSSANAALIMLALLWSWLGMEIVDDGHADLSRQAVKRASRHLDSPAVRVIKLRRVRYASDADGTSRDVDWKHCWFVSAHDKHNWRDRAYREHRDQHEGRTHHADPTGVDKHCVVCGGETLHIKQYLKGPDGKPLMAARTIYKLAR